MAKLSAGKRCGGEILGGGDLEERSGQIWQLGLRFGGGGEGGREGKLGERSGGDLERSGTRGGDPGQRREGEGGQISKDLWAGEGRRRFGGGEGREEGGGEGRRGLNKLSIWINIPKLSLAAV